MTAQQKWELIDALEAIQQELRAIDFYGQAAEDNLERLHRALTRTQRADVSRIDHALQRSRELVKNVRSALEAAITSAMETRARTVKPRR